MLRLRLRNHALRIFQQKAFVHAEKMAGVATHSHLLGGKGLQGVMTVNPGLDKPEVTMSGIIDLHKRLTTQLQSSIADAKLDLMKEISSAKDKDKKTRALVFALLAVAFTSSFATSLATLYIRDNILPTAPAPDRK
ncbi:hypothetical protein V8E54_008928 [Elaphomyces granulatus]|jgi:hypothetical protein